MAESALWLDMGLGKTVITLTSIGHLINCGIVNAVVIVAPVRVCRLVWRQEALKWAHTKGLTFSMVMGNKDQRTRALLQTANVYLINYENLGWLAENLHTYFINKGRPLPFNGLVWDEISKCKNSATQRVKSIKKILSNFVWKTGLTGTPASNGYKDLHGQYLVLDEGRRLGASKTQFKTRFYRKISQFKEVAYDDTEEQIKSLIGDMTLEMSAADYNPLPDLIVNNVDVELPDDLRRLYNRMEKDFFISLDSGAEVEMFNQASLTNKCLQFSNGAMYPVAGMPLWEAIHELKLDALEEIIDEAQGQPILCSYSYRSDAERIMNRFAHLHPINLTECKSEASLINAMARWKAGDCALMIGHPACLHPETEVLTEWRGWVKIIDVELSDRVFDGVEFVSHSGCSYSGHKNVVDVFGITMTHNHKLLISGEWVEAKDVRNSGNIKREALYQYEGNDEYLSKMLEVWGCVESSSPKCNEAQQREKTILSALYQGNFSQHDEHKNMGDLAGNETQSIGQIGQELWWSRNRVMRGLEGLQKILQGYVRRIFGRVDNRTGRCEQELHQRKLHLGHYFQTTVEQTKQSVFDLPRGDFASCRGVQKVRGEQNDDDYETKQRNEYRTGYNRCAKFKLWKESETYQCETERKAHVYDLVDCGVRHRFVIRNGNGEVFISHNSMGHGVDGLQEKGHIVVWFGLNWSLDLYEQMNARIRRQGQGAPVICHHILCTDTLDQAQAIALKEKATTQNGLRAAIKLYRACKI
jgi:hypothetical protein